MGAGLSAHSPRRFIIWLIIWHLQPAVGYPLLSLSLRLLPYIAAFFATLGGELLPKTPPQWSSRATAMGR